MIRWILLFLMMVSMGVQAGSLRADGGRTLINEGDSVDVLLMSLGEPQYKRKVAVCMSEKRGVCLSWGTIETWFYRYNDMNWKIQVIGDRINKISWSRY